MIVLPPSALVARQQVGEHGARQARIVDATVLEEAIVLGRQHRIDHLARDGLEGQRNAALLTELGDQSPVAAEHPQAAPAAGCP